MPLRPCAHRLKVTVYMACIEVDERLRIRAINPDRTKYANVHVAHEALADKVDDGRSKEERYKEAATPSTTVEKIVARHFEGLA